MNRIHVFAADSLIADRESLPKEWSGAPPAGDIPDFGAAALTGLRRKVGRNSHVLNFRTHRIGCILQSRRTVGTAASTLALHPPKRQLRFLGDVHVGVLPQCLVALLQLGSGPINLQM